MFMYMLMGTAQQPLQYFHLYTQLGTMIHSTFENATSK